ncbi:MAG: hypothetical protein ACOC07_07100, partial [Coleofasciculus sp.]
TNGVGGLVTNGVGGLVTNGVGGLVTKPLLNQRFGGNPLDKRQFRLKMLPFLDRRTIPTSGTAH